ncbi:MAG TPA: HXXEE domain-containing protein [Candidatus Tumulicola sp.]
MNFYRHHWYYVGGVLFIALAVFMVFGRSLFSPIQIILIFSFMAMLAHQVEEYALPGGFPAISNILVMREKIAPDRYPLNANQCMICNVLLTYPFFIAAIAFPNIIWLGLAQVGLGLFQIVGHGIVTPIMMKKLYNPGLATNVLLFYPIGIYYIWYVSSNKLASPTDYVLGAVATLGAAALLFGLPIILLRNRNSRYPFSQAEMNRFARR